MILFEVMNGVERADRQAVVAEQLRQCPEACVHHDPQHRGPLFTMLQCLEHATARAEVQFLDWVVVLQDDAEPVPGWREHLDRVLEVAPAPLLGLTYCGFGYRVPKTDADFTVGRYTLQGGAFAIHRSLLLCGMSSWLRFLWENDRVFNDDTALAAYARWVGYETACVTHALFTQTLATTIRGHQKHNPPPTKLITDRSPQQRYDRRSVERLPYVEIDKRFGQLLQFRYEALSQITPTQLMKNEVWP